MRNLKLAIYAFVGLLISGSSYAALNCSAHPSCETMGYSKTETCENGSLIYCPFDTSYKKCITASAKIDCEELGFIYDYGDNMDWCEDVIYCPTDSSYFACVGMEDCESMGFIPDEMNENDEYMWEWCENIVHCPGSPYYIACADSTYPTNTISCQDIGFTTSEKSEWCSNIVYCPFDSDYTLCGGECVWADECTDTVSGYIGTYASWTYSSCTACGTTAQIKTGWQCNSGYRKLEKGTFGGIANRTGAYAYNDIDGSYCAASGTKYWSVSKYESYSSCTRSCSSNESCNICGDSYGEDEWSCNMCNSCYDNCYTYNQPDRSV